MTNEWLNYEWFYIKTKKDLIESLKLIPDDAEIKKDTRLVIHLPTNKYIIQFREHDFS